MDTTNVVDGFQYTDNTRAQFLATAAVVDGFAGAGGTTTHPGSGGKTANADVDAAERRPRMVSGTDVAGDTKRAGDTTSHPARKTTNAGIAERRSSLVAGTHVDAGNCCFDCFSTTPRISPAIAFTTTKEAIFEQL